MRKSLLDKIENEAIDGDIVKALRLCIKLGGHTRSTELRKWALLQLNGYGDDQEVPQYRKFPVTLYIDGAIYEGIVKGQLLPLMEIPKDFRDSVPEELIMGQSVPAIIELLKSPDESIVISTAELQLLVSVMNRTGEINGQIERIYCKYSKMYFQDVVEQVRNKVIELVSELRSETDDGQDMPTPERASKAIEAAGISIVGDNNEIRVNSPSPEIQTHHGGDSIAWWKKPLVKFVGTAVGTVALGLLGYFFGIR